MVKTMLGIFVVIGGQHALSLKAEKKRVQGGHPGLRLEVLWNFHFLKNLMVQNVFECAGRRKSFRVLKEETTTCSRLAACCDLRLIDCAVAAYLKSDVRICVFSGSSCNTIYICVTPRRQNFCHNVMKIAKTTNS